MKKDYEDIFTQRGNAYDAAMKLFPYAREQEFKQAIHSLKLLSGMKVADVPSGGGYLSKFLPDNIVCLEHEACESFHLNNSSQNLPGSNAEISLFPFPWIDASIDALISLAGLHHQEQKSLFFSEAFRVVKPNGTMVISDVMESSSVALFLDDFVGAHNSTGHEGIYLNKDTEKEIVSQGWSIQNINLNDFFWTFDSTQNMAEFCIKLFDMQNISIASVIEGIADHVGFETLPNNKIGMRWQLLTITANK